jgi:hypothetical protein
MILLSDTDGSVATVLEALLHQSAILCQSMCIVFSFKFPINGLGWDST